MIAEFWLNRPKVFVSYYLAIATVILFNSHLIGFILYLQPLQELPTTELKVGIVQGNIPNEIKLLPDGFSRAIVGYTEGYLNLADQGVSAVLTPEGALPIYQSQLNQTPLIRAIQEKGVVAWIGAFDQKGEDYTNSIFTILGNGQVFSHYDKYKLVPLGEYIPFAQFLGSIIQRLSPIDTTLIPGAANQIFATPFGRAIAGICYESAFSANFPSSSCCWWGIYPECF